MALPVTQTDTRDKAFTRIQDTAGMVKSQSETMRQRLAGGAVSINYIIEIYEGVTRHGRLLNRLKSLPGLQEHARDQLNDPIIDYVGELNSVIQAMAGVQGEVVALLPVNANGFILARKLTATGVDTGMVTIAQTSVLRNKLDALTASID